MALPVVVANEVRRVSTLGIDERRAGLRADLAAVAFFTVVGHGASVVRATNTNGKEQRRSERNQTAHAGRSFAPGVPGPRCFILIVLALVLVAGRAEAFPSLAAVVERARAHGPSVVLAGADLSVAGATRHAAGLAPLTNPYAELIAEHGKYTEDVALTGSVYLPVELSGQRRARISEVTAMMRWKTAARASAAASAIGEAVSAYGENVVAAARLREAGEGERVAREEATYIGGRLSVGDATSVDQALADGETARWLQSKSEAEVALSLAHARLAIALGDARLDTPAEDDVVDLPRLRTSNASAQAVRLRGTSPALLAPTLEASYFAATRQRLEAEKYPPLNLILRGGRGDLGEARIGGGLAWTFPFLRSNQGEIARAGAEEARALTSRSIVAGALDARLIGLSAAYDVVARAVAGTDAAAIPAAQTVVDACVRAWKAGKLDLQRVFLARRDLATARARRLDLIASGWRTYGDLAGIVGDLP